MGIYIMSTVLIYIYIIRISYICQTREGIPNRFILKNVFKSRFKKEEWNLYRFLCVLK